MRRLIPVLAALAMASAASGGLVYDNGPPDYASGHELTQWTQAEDFQFASDTTLGSAGFSMLTFNQLTNWDGALDWWIYNDAGGLPGTLYASGAGQNVNPVFDQNSGGWDFYDFTFDFGGAGVPVSGGTTYWLALHAASDWLVRDDLYWSTTSSNATYSGHEDYMNQGNWTAHGYQHSFQLYSPAPGSLALLGLASLAARRRRR